MSDSGERGPRHPVGVADVLLRPAEGSDEDARVLGLGPRRVLERELAEQPLQRLVTAHREVGLP